MECIRCYNEICWLIISNCTIFKRMSHNKEVNMPSQLFHVFSNIKRWVKKNRGSEYESVENSDYYPHAEDSTSHSALLGASSPHAFFRRSGVVTGRYDDSATKSLMGNKDQGGCYGSTETEAQRDVSEKQPTLGDRLKASLSGRCVIS